MALSDSSVAQLQQMLEVLDGTRRSGDRGRAAARLADLDGLLLLPETLKSDKAAGATPTAAEFDALVEDVATIHLRLRAVIAALRTRRGR